ncbi:MAG: twin-arginine translocation signal domain-containing protein, partial [Rhizobiaceae bacterium]|nr:twin-arginine translocation signal domain-containing protein [Rhizobiaceae bacterium]
MFTRRDFIQFSAVAGGALGLASGFGGNLTRALAQQRLTQDDLLKFDSKGQITLLHFTDVHAQLKPVYFRPPSENFGVGAFEGIPPHLVGEEFLNYFKIDKGSALSYAHTMVDYVNMAKAY